MQIGSISSIPAIDAASPASITAETTGSRTAKAASPEGHAETSAVASVDTQPASVSVGTGSARVSLSQGVISGAEQALAAVYTTAVAGHNYLGTVQQTAGEYLASVADPPAPPISGVGSSIQAAENNLTMVIDETV
jgi:hypothetical protein